MVPQGTDTKKVTDVSVTVITEQTFHVDEQAVSILCARKSCVTGPANGVRSRVDFKPGEPGDNVAALISLVDRAKAIHGTILA